MNLNVYIITAVHNSLSTLKVLLESIDRQVYKNYSIIIVDDGSTDGTSEFVQSNYPKITLLHGDGTLWWSGSMNLAISYALKNARDGDYILTINDDCVVNPTFISNILKNAIKFPNSIIGSFVVDSRNKNLIIDGPTLMNSSKGYPISKYARMSINNVNPDKIYSSDTLTTRGTLYPVVIFSSINNFDTKHFPHHIADIDLSLRARKFGFSLLVPGNTVVYNDPTRTGIALSSGFSSRPERFHDCISLLFGRRSTSNVFDRVNFIKIHVEKNHQKVLYIRLLKSSLSILTSWKPIFYIKKLLRPIYLPLVNTK